MKRTVFERDHDDFRTSVAQFIDRVVRPRLPEMVEQRCIPREIWRALGSQGLLGLEVPEKLGGGGSSDFRFNAVLGEELARVSAALNSSFGIHYDVVLPYLLELATDEQQRRWLPSFCKGELITAIAMTEPSGGSDLASLSTRAMRDGDDWLISGSKTFITNGASADLVLVAARTTPNTGKSGISLFVLEYGMPGFERGQKLRKLGQHEADTAELFFDDVRVPKENILGDIGDGFRNMMQRLPRERLSASVANIAHASHAFDETLAYVKSRKAFDTPIGSFQSNKFWLAELSTKLDAAQCHIDACIGAFVDGYLTNTDAAKAKLLSSEVQNEVLDACLQLHGGYGYMEECRVAQAWADGRVTKIWAGTNQIMKEVIGRGLGL
jgi:alkylation response protein AidB-like acyl-CoA dehydrogenase